MPAACSKEGVPAMLVTIRTKTTALTLALAFAPLLAGCVTPQTPWVSMREPAAPALSRVDAMWQSRIQVTQDTVNQGRPLIGLVGRMYLFGPDMMGQDPAPQKGDGSV